MTVQGPVKKLQPNGMSQKGGGCVGGVAVRNHGKSTREFSDLDLSFTEGGFQSGRILCNKFCTKSLWSLFFIVFLRIHAPGRAGGRAGGGGACVRNGHGRGASTRPAARSCGGPLPDQTVCESVCGCP